MKPKGKNESIILLRVFATLLVVLGHALRDAHAPNPHLFEPIYTSGIEVFLKKFIYSFHMPLFFWISGYVYYLSLEKTDGVTQVFKTLSKKVERVLVPLYATAFLLLLPSMVFFGDLKVTVWEQVRSILLAEQSDHLWFLKTLFLTFLVIVPVSKYLYRYGAPALLAAAIAAFVIHFWFDYAALFKFIPYFLIGMATRAFEGDIRHPKVLPYVLIFIHISLFLYAYVHDLGSNEYLKYTIALFGIYAWYTLSHLLVEKGVFASAWEKIVSLDNSSYTIYLFHVSFLYLLLYFMHTFGIESDILRIVSFMILGVAAPVALEKLLSRSKIGAWLFSIPYKKAH